MLTRRAKRKLILAVLLLALLALMGLAYANYSQTRKIGLDFNIEEAELLSKPEYLYSFGGPAEDRLVKPEGVFIHGDRVYVADARRSVVDVFNLDGKRLSQIGKGVLKTPLYVGLNPKDGRLYVADKRTRSLHIFDRSGKHIGVFDPKLPKNQLPKFDTNGAQWVPNAFTFAEDGSLYIIDLLRGHRLLIFDPAGKFKKSVGDAGMANEADGAPQFFQFPNSVKIIGDEVWIADSNNRRMQVFSREGEFVRLMATEGLPRGFQVLKPTPGQKKDSPPRFAVVDTLAHDVTIWDVKGEKLVNFGENGVLEGQFSFPNDLSVDAKGRIFIADTSNGRIQVWGWPEQVNPVPVPRTPMQWLLCLAPLLLLPLLALLRRKRFMATPEFVVAMAATADLESMPARRRRWVAWEPEHSDAMAAMKAGDGRSVSEIVEFDPVPHSDSDARALAERLEIDERHAAIMSLAQRVKVFCTEDPELRRLAKLLEVDVCDKREFLERFGAKQGEKPREDVA